MTDRRTEQQSLGLAALRTVPFMGEPSPASLWENRGGFYFSGEELKSWDILYHMVKCHELECSSGRWYELHNGVLGGSYRILLG